MIRKVCVIFDMDGSYEKNLRQSRRCWCISTQNGKEISFRVCSIEGDLDRLNSYCAKLEAIRSLLYCLRLLLTIHNISLPENWSIFIWIDNSSVLDKAGLDEYEPDIVTNILAVCD